MVRLLAGAHKLQFKPAVAQLGSTIVAVHGKACLRTEFSGKRLGKTDTAAHGHEVDIVRRTVQKNIAHISANDVARLPDSIGCLAIKKSDSPAFSTISIASS